MASLQKSSTVLRWLGLAGLLIATFAAGVYGRAWLGLDRSTASSNDADHDAQGHDHDHEHGGHDHAGHDHDHEGHDEANSIELSDQAKKNIGLELATVELKPFERTITVPGIVVERPGQSTVEVTAPLTGIVTRIYPIQGQTIGPGQPLFELRLTHEELVQAQSNFLSTAEELDVIRKEVTRLKKIASDGIAGKTLLEREYEQQKKEAALRAQEEALLLHGLTEEQVQSILENRKLLRTLTVYSPPGNGNEKESDEKTVEPTLYQVQDLTVEQGQHVEAGHTLCSLVDHSQLYIEGRTFEQDADEINRAAAQGWKVTALSESDAQQHLDGLSILYVSGKVDLESRALHFYVVLPNEMLQQTESAGRTFIYWRFKPGQRMQIRVPVETWADRIVLPVEAVAQDGVESYVFEPNGDHFDRKPVHVEHRDQLFAVIENDGALFPGDTIARSGAQQLQLALKNKSGGAIDPHAGHNHQPLMLNAVIRFALTYRVLTMALAVVTLVYGAYVMYHLPVDIFPDLDRPRVTVMTEAPGLAPEEVETLITLPLESALNGATGVQTVRSSSGIGLSVIYVEFGWETDIYIDRQVVAEKLVLAGDRLPTGVKPQMAPISSLMGQIMLIGMWSAGDRTDPVEVRTLADWVVRQRLLTIPGVAQVVTMGGGRKQYQVLVNPEQLLTYGVTLHDVEKAVAESNENATGGYLNRGSHEYLVRSIGRIESAEDLQSVVVKADAERPVLLGQVARIAEAAQVKRGDAAVNGKPAVMLVISKQPGADTRLLTDHIETALADLQGSLPKDVRLKSDIFQQKGFIEIGITNVIHALRDGSVLVVVILFLFLLNFRTTFITLTAIPLSILITALVFKWFGMSINTMTLGGLAVAIGELVDDAIVDVENIFRRLRENRHVEYPKPALRVVYEASSEVRNSIVFSTILVVLVFIPLFALGGMEGRLFKPLGVAYIVSIIASLLVSLTVTPVLSYWLLPQARFMAHDKDGPLLRFLKWIAGFAIRFSVRHPLPILSVVALAVAVSVLAVTQLGRDFLPPFNEGTVQVNLFLPPGTSLETSNRIASIADERIGKIEGVIAFGRRTGRAELDEHAEGVNVSEVIVSFDPSSHRTREEVLHDIRTQLADIPGLVVSAEQPLQHLISHMLSGVKAQVGIKLYGDDLAVLRAKANEMKNAIAGVPGVTDLMVEQQVEIPQVRVELDRKQLAYYGLNSRQVNEFIETAMNGRTVSQVVHGQRTFDLVVRLDRAYRENLDYVRRLSLEIPSGGRVPISSVANIVESSGPNTINRENVRRRIIVQCNTSGRDLAGVVADIQARLANIEKPTGYFVEYSGQFESQQSATRMIALLSLASLACMFFALYTLFRSTNLALQVLAALPMAAIGAVTALVITRQSLTIASMVGFISLSGIASRNGILLIAHYLHLIRHEGEPFSLKMIERAGKERLAPMLMTALTAGIALIPLVLAAGEPGKEILYPVATVILGGLVSSTLLDFFVHPALFWLFGRKAAERMDDPTETLLDNTRFVSSGAVEPAPIR